MLDGRNDRMYVLRDNGTSVEIEKIVQLPDVTGYVRSFSILDGYLYVTAGIGSESIVQLDYRHDWAVVDKYYVPEEVRGMNALCRIGDFYYLTAYEDFTTYDENAIIELDSQEDGTLQAAGYVYFQRGHVSASDEVYRSKQS